MIDSTVCRAGERAVAGRGRYGEPPPPKAEVPRAGWTWARWVPADRRSPGPASSGGCASRGPTPVTRLEAQEAQPCGLLFEAGLAWPHPLPSLRCQTLATTSGHWRMSRLAQRGAALRRSFGAPPGATRRGRRQGPSAVASEDGRGGVAGMGRTRRPSGITGPRAGTPMRACTGVARRPGAGRAWPAGPTASPIRRSAAGVRVPTQRADAPRHVFASCACASAAARRRGHSAGRPRGGHRGAGHYQPVRCWDAHDAWRRRYTSLSATRSA